MHDKKFVKLFKNSAKELERKNVMSYLTMPMLYRNFLKCSIFLHGYGKRGTQYREIVQFIFFKNKNKQESPRLNEIIQKLRNTSEELTMKAFSRLKPNSTKKIKIEGFINLTSDSIDDTTNGNIEKYFDQNILPRFMPLHSISGLVGVGENAQKMIIEEITNLNKEVDELNEKREKRKKDDVFEENSLLHRQILERKRTIFGETEEDRRKREKSAKRRSRRLRAKKNKFNFS